MASAGSLDCAPKYGRRLLPTLVDEMATSNPDHVHASIPRSQDFSGGFHDVTSRELARGVDRVAFCIERILGKSVDFETIAYLGLMDLRYFIVAIAASKVGYKTLLPSPRNNIEGHLALLEHMSCNVLISPVEAKVGHILSKRNMHHSNVDALQEILRDDSAEHYEYNKTFEEAAQDPFIVVHTSGSTGLPKPIVLYHGGIATVDSQHLISPLDEFGPQIKFAEAPVRVFSCLPPFHVASVMQNLACALYYKETIVWPPPGRPISTGLIDDLLEHVKVDVLFLVPSTLEEVSQSQTSLERLKRVKYVRYAGGPLSKAAGDTISRYTKVLNVLGSSEAGYLPLLHRDPEDWIYFHFDPRMKGFEFRNIGPGLYELVFTRHESTDLFHWAFYTFSNRPEISMNDVFSKHPSKPNLWLYEGRSDDVIVFSNGEKFNPNGMEVTLSSSPKINGALVLGQGKFEAVALLEPKENFSNTTEAREAILDDLAPYISKANQDAPAYAKIVPDHVLFTTADKPMLRTDKGTVKRRATYRAYEKEIDSFYADVEGSSNLSEAIQLDPRDQNAVTICIRNALSEMDRLRDLHDDLDFFATGMDSLQVLRLVRQLQSSFSDYSEGVMTHLISPRTIYSYPSILKLATAIRYMAEHGDNASQGLDKEKIGKMESLLAKYSQDLPQPKDDTTQQQKQGLTVILTGSTGSLGSYLLHCLLAGPQITKVICLNRGTDSETKQTNINKSRGLINEWGERAQFLTTDLSKGDLGLGHDDYQMLVKEASAIIHNQWQVDFNLSLESFEPHIAGVRGLINLSNQSPKSPSILFTSSISTVDNWAYKNTGDKVPESGFSDFRVPAAMGYGESKYVAEQLLEEAGKRPNVSAAICRVGQLAGPVVKGGIWSKQEWLPSLIATSKYLGKIPTSLPGQDTVAWIPVDVTASIIVDLLVSDINDDTSTAPWTKYHNVVNPHPGSWEALVLAITEYWDDKIEPVSFEAWFEALRATASRTEDVAANPGVKLLEFFEQMASAGGVVELETERTAERSPAMRGLKAVGPEWMRMWLGQWGF